MSRSIQVIGVTKAFAGKKLFEDVNTSFPPGRRYGLTGPNGAGKSTFMKILSGDLEPDTGQRRPSPSGSRCSSRSSSPSRTRACSTSS